MKHTADYNLRPNSRIGWATLIIFANARWNRRVAAGPFPDCHFPTRCRQNLLYNVGTMIA
jgi:hypothetical protein